MLPGSSRASQIVHVDPVALSIQQSLALPLGWQARSPTFVPRRGGAVGEGYLVAPVLGPDWDEVWILRADDLPYGPVCRLRHARFDVGLCSGAIWMPELSASRASYRVDRGADYAEGKRDCPAS